MAGNHQIKHRSPIWKNVVEAVKIILSYHKKSKFNDWTNK